MNSYISITSVNEANEKKISLPEAIIMIMIVGFADLLEIATDLLEAVPLIGQVFLFFSPIVDICVLAIVQFWLIMKGGIAFKKMASSLVGNIVEFIPGLDILPIRTVTLIVTIYLINHPEKAKIVQVATPSQAIKGKIETT